MMAPGGGEFAVPARPDELVGVDEVDTDVALRSFNGVVDSLCDSPTSIAEPDNLGVLCALIRGYADVGDNIKSRVFDVLLSGLSCLAVHSDSLAAAPPDSHPASEFREVRNALRIHAFLLKWMASLAERAASEAGQEVKHVLPPSQSGRQPACKLSPACGRAGDGQMPSAIRQAEDSSSFFFARLLAVGRSSRQPTVA